MRWNLLLAGLAVAGLAAAAVAAPGAPAASAAGVPGPVVELQAAQNYVSVPAGNGPVRLDPGIYVASLGSALEFDVRRAGYTSPITITQVIHTPAGQVQTRRLPATVLDGFYGLKDFVKMTVRTSTGTPVGHPFMLTFCPNANAQRASPSSPAASPYPLMCGQDPFPLSMVWGIAKGWAADPAFRGPMVRLGPGNYQITETITAAYTRLFHISPSHATKTVHLKLLNHGDAAHGAGHGAGHAGLAALPRVPYLAHPPTSVLPDLVALPSWGISTSHTRSGSDLLDFGATVWVGGHGPLDVEGFRSHGSPVMTAYQYFWRHGRVIGRARAGTMGFGGQRGPYQWQFPVERYTLLNAAKSVAVAGEKVGFCISPSDPVDLLAPGAVRQPPVAGSSRQCGQPFALWVREMLPVGWGDTYVNTAACAFDITHVPNGTYYIQVTANPQKVLHETTTGNDTSLRKVILGGTPGHRTVTVPAWHGIDPEP